MRKLFLSLAVLALVLGVTPALAGASPSADAPAEVQPRLAETLRTAAPTDEFIVFAHANDIATAEQAVLDSGLAPLTTWDAIGVAVGQGTTAEIRRAIAHDGVTYVEQDQPIEFLTDTSHLATRGAQLLANSDLDGSGISIAINDTGVDGNHPAFELPDGTSKVARNVKSVCPFLTPTEPDPDHFLNECFVDVPGNDTDTTSVGGHGTHVAGTAAGVRDTTAGGEEVHGAAPGATLIGLSVGATISIYAGNQGLNWVLEHHEDPCATQTLPTRPTSCAPIKVVNNSWGPPGGGEFNPESAVSKIQDALIAEGVVVVWAAGNDGGDGSTNVVNPPAQSPTPGVLGVANYDDQEEGTRDGTLNGSSSRGKDGRPETYPDLSAPGTNILQACTYALTICRAHGDLRYPWYAEISGTSMAAPHVAGIVAQLFQAGAASPAQVEDVLEDTAYEFSFGAAYEDDPRNPDSQTSYDKGHGLVDVLAAVEVVTGTDIDGDGTIGSGLDGGTSTGDANVCATDQPFLTDAGGDTTTGVNSDALDVVWGDLATNGTADLVLKIEVVELGESAPAGTDGEYLSMSAHLDLDRTDAAGSEEWGLHAERSTALGPYFTVTDPDGTTIEVDGAFDPEANTVTVHVPASVTGMTADGEVQALSVSTYRNYAGVGVLRADQAASDCAYAVGEVTEETNSAPVASFAYDPEQPRTGETVTFDASGSTDPDGDTLTYTWDLGDGTTAEGQAVTHVYADPGRYTVTLTVDDGAGGTDTATQHVVVRGGGGDQGPPDRDDKSTVAAATAGGDEAALATAVTSVGGGPLGLAALALAGLAYRTLRRRLA